MAALLRPPQDGVLCDDVLVVEKPDDVLEDLQQLAVLITVDLHS